MNEYIDTSKYSDDQQFRWWWERRWGPGEALCWVGLNPSTGDTSGRPRPTLRKVVALARSEGLDAVVVVNLFSFRSTDPKELQRVARHQDVIGDRTDQFIRSYSEQAAVTLAAWGAHGSLRQRGAGVASMLDNPVCLGTTKHGEPRHPLYVRSDTALEPYRPGR